MNHRSACNDTGSLPDPDARIVISRGLHLEEHTQKAIQLLEMFREVDASGKLHNDFISCQEKSVTNMVQHKCIFARLIDRVRRTDRWDKQEDGVKS
jgi:hypothetical protein